MMNEQSKGQKMDWILDGQSVTGEYCGVPVSGIVASSRVKYGGKVQYTVHLFESIQLKWRSEPTHTVLLDEENIVANIKHSL